MDACESAAAPPTASELCAFSDAEGVAQEGGWREREREEEEEEERVSAPELSAALLLEKKKSLFLLREKL